MRNGFAKILYVIYTTCSSQIEFSRNSAADLFHPKRNDIIEEFTVQPTAETSRKLSMT